LNIRQEIVMVSPGDEIRIARSEALRRDVNERIADTAGRFGADDASFVCECGQADCTHRVRATREEYEAVRADSAQFMVVGDHVQPSVEAVVERAARFTVVAKLSPRARSLVERLDPRRRRR
jgi:hypothetical protein